MFASRQYNSRTIDSSNAVQPLTMYNSNNMKKHIKLITQIAVCLALTLCSAARAEDKKIDLNGSWKSSTTNQNGQARETIYKLKVEDGKLSGTVSGRNGDITIENAKLKGDEITFTVTRENNGNKVVIKYSGKLDGDTIKGKAESERDGKTQSRDWTAKRNADADKAPDKK